jgi:DNA-binding transcriptional LysR family regulator
MDRLDTMRLFLRVAEAGSFSRAAADLGLGQPTVSRRIQDLEAGLGAALFVRTTRALSLTGAGEKFYQRARAILEEFDTAQAEARGLDREPVGVLRVTAAHSLTRRIIAPVLPGFLELYPLIRFDLLEDDSYVDLVEQGVDVALRFGELPDSTLMARKLSQMPRGVWASPGYLSAHGAPAHPSDLARHEAVLFRHSSHGAEWAFTHESGETASVRVDGRIKISSGDTLVRLAMEGAGLIWAPDWLVSEEVAGGRLVPVLEGWTGSPLTLQAVWPGPGKLKGKSQVFVDYLCDRLAQR